MKVPYQLRWRPTSEPATALLVLGHRAEDVLHVCAELGADPVPPIHLVADGFLLLLAKPNERQFPGVIRLRALSENLLVPVNADLIPALLLDEAAALVKKRGLVFLPGERVLEFDAGKPIALASLLRIDAPRQRRWQALPTPPALADTLTEITHVGIDTSPDDIIQQGGQGIGEENPKLGEGNPATQLLGRTLFKLGKSIANLGNAMNSKTLSGLGARILGAAMSMSPKLSEELMGSQEAVLRELLRQFREGNIDVALKHALPLSGDAARGAVPAMSAQLPTHNLFYSLVNLLGGSGGGGAASFWFTPDNTYYELLKEYQKQADLAVQRGDFRRAAFIYAKLLNDFANAARVLAQGGLHRDAAVIYEKKLKDLRQAAKEWEAAGEIDRAIQLHRQLGDHAMAGDLLRKIGEEDRAVAEYQIAASKLIVGGARYYEAGELLRGRGQRPDLALEYYVQGWHNRPAPNALACATRMVQHHADAGKAEPFLTTLTEAEEFLEPSDAESTATFFTEVARLSKAPPLEDIADEVHDRALVGMAKKARDQLQESPRHAGALANLFKTSSVWPVPLVGDAQYALSEASRRPRAAKAPRSLHAGRSSVTAVCQLPTTGEVILGFENGEVVRFVPATSELHSLLHEDGPIVSLSVDPKRTHVLVLSQLGLNQMRLRTIRRDESFRSIDVNAFDVTAPTRLAHPAVNSPMKWALLLHGSHYRFYQLPSLVGVLNGELSEERGTPDAVVFGRHDAPGAPLWILAQYGNDADLWMPGASAGEVGAAGSWKIRRSYTLGWTLATGEKAALTSVPLRAVMRGEETIEITGISIHGNVYRSTLGMRDPFVDTVSFHASAGYCYRAFACVRADAIAAVHAKGIDWWTTSRAKPVQTKHEFADPVAALSLPDARELLIVEAGGQLTRVPMAE